MLHILCHAAGADLVRRLEQRSKTPFEARDAEHADAPCNVQRQHSPIRLSGSQGQVIGDDSIPSYPGDSTWVPQALYVHDCPALSPLTSSMAYILVLQGRPTSSMRKQLLMLLACACMPAETYTFYTDLTRQVCCFTMYPTGTRSATNAAGVHENRQTLNLLTQAQHAHSYSGGYKAHVGRWSTAYHMSAGLTWRKKCRAPGGAHLCLGEGGKAAQDINC